MKYAVIGDRGMFGSEMHSLLNEKGLNVTGFNRANLDLATLSAEQLATTLDGFGVIINAVAYTAVDKAEVNRVAAEFANGVIVEKLAQSAAKLGSRLVHISTDYVFDGFGTTPYPVTHQLNPQTEYGRSKAKGEQLLFESEANFSILRTAWLYGKFGGCFPKAIASALEDSGSARVVQDQIGQPTWTRDLAEQVLAYATFENAPKIIHAVSSGKCSWADFAVEVAETLGLQGSSIVGIPTDEYPTPAKRPAWSVLDNSSELVKPIGDWRARWLVAAEEVLGSR